MSKSISISEAVQILSDVESIYQWNEVRDMIKATVPMDVWVREYLPVIDGSGLVVTVLGPDM